MTDVTLDGLVAAYDSQDPALALAGHPASDAPAYACVGKFAAGC